MADNVTLPGTGALVSSEEVTTLNGGAVSAQQVQRVINSVRTADGTAVDIQGDASNGLDVDVTRLPGVAGTVAHDTGDSGNPVKVGGRAVTTLADDTMVADGDRSDIVTDIDGAQITRHQCPLGDILSERISNTNGTSTAFSTFGATASTRNYVSTISVFNDSNTNAYVDIRDGTAGTILLTIPAPARGGAVFNLPVPLRQPTANTALAYDVSAAITTMYISVIGFKSKA